MDRAAETIENMGELKDDPEAIWSVAAAARFLGIAPNTLNQWRHAKKGPDFVQLSATRVGYQRAALVAWLQQRVRRQPTAG